MKKISSKDNKNVKLAHKLRNKKYRDEEGLFLLEGKRAVGEALKIPALVRALYIDDRLIDDFELLINDNEFDSYLVDNRIMNYISSTTTPQGIAALVKIPVWSWDDMMKNQGLLIFLDEISDPGNLGTIIRTCMALNGDGIILSQGCVDPFSPKVVRASMGSILHTPLLTDAGLNELYGLEDLGYDLICTDLLADNYYFDENLCKRKVIVFGNEARGVCKEIKNLCKLRIKIPINPEIESLNAASACAIIMAEAWKQYYER